MRALGRLSIMVTSAMLAACTDHGGPCAKHRFANGRACDIRDTSCQVQIFEAVRCVRGTEGTLPSVRVIDADTYRQELMPGPEADPDPDTSEETEAPTDHWSASLALLGLLPEDTTARAARTAEALDWVTAFYSALYRDVTIIDRGEPREPEDNVTLLAHEFVHALQDEVSGSEELSERGSRNDDAILARTALSEGEATLVEDLAYAALFDLSPHDLYPTEYYEYRLRWARNVALRADAPYPVIRRIGYGMGAKYLWALREEEGQAAIAALWDNPPATTVRWMAGHDASPEGSTQWEVPFDCNGPRAPTGYIWSSSDALGALTLAIVVGLHDGQQLRSGARSWNVALGWRGDRYRVFSNEAGDTALGWQIRMNTPAALDAVLAAFERLAAPHELIVEDGLEVTLLVGPDAGMLRAWRDGWKCIPNSRPMQSDPGASASRWHRPFAH